MMEHTVECPVSREFAWRFWSNVANWAIVDPAVESVVLDGPFESGSKGVTHQTGGAAIEWVLADVVQGSSAVIEIRLPGVSANFRLLFEDSEGGGASITQTVTFEGEQLDQYDDAIKRLAEELPAGMKRLVDRIVEAEMCSRGASS